MSVWFYDYAEFGAGWLVLFDGQNTYWDDDMNASSGYSIESLKANGRFVYIGEL
jgi:hypothetical protein